MMEFELTHQLSELSKSALVLNQETDSINELIERFEDTLRGMNLGVQVWVSTPFHCEAAGDYEWRTYLGWLKRWAKSTRQRKYDWRVVVQTRGFSKDSNKETQPDSPKALVEASLNIRIAALTALPELVAALKSAADGRTREIQEAKGLVEGSISKTQTAKTAGNEKIRSIQDAKKIAK